MDDLPEPFECRVIPDRGAVRVVVSGALDMATAPELTAALVRLRRDEVAETILDLRELSFLDSMGLRCILAANAATRGSAYALTLIPGPPVVQRVFELAGVTPTLAFRAG